MIDLIPEDSQTIGVLGFIALALGVKLWWDRRSGGPRGRR